VVFASHTFASSFEEEQGQIVKTGGRCSGKHHSERVVSGFAGSEFWPEESADLRRSQRRGVAAAIPSAVASPRDIVRNIARPRRSRVPERGRSFMPMRDTALGTSLSLCENCARRSQRLWGGETAQVCARRAHRACVTMFDSTLHFVGCRGASLSHLSFADSALMRGGSCAAGLEKVQDRFREGRRPREFAKERNRKTQRHSLARIARGGQRKCAPLAVPATDRSRSEQRLRGTGKFAQTALQRNRQSFASRGSIALR